MTAAYVTVPGVTAEEAEAQGLVEVETFLNGPFRTPVFGYYTDPDAPGTPPKRKGKGATAGDAAPEVPEADAATGG
jgi:hypothetical protein